MREDSMYPICRHLLASGRRCTQPAVRRTGASASGSSFVGCEALYCRHHQVVKAKLAQIVPIPDPYGWDRKPLPLVVSEDRAAIHLNYSIVIAAFNAGRIDIKTANCFNRLLRSCEINLSHGPLFDPETQAVQHVELTPEGDEIAPATEQASQSKNLAIPSEATRESEATGEADSEPAPDSAAEAEHRFRDWQQSPQGQSFDRMHRQLNPHLYPHLSSPDPDTGQPGHESQNQTIEASPTTLGPDESPSALSY